MPALAEHNAENWVHHYPYILKAGRIKHKAPQGLSEEDQGHVAAAAAAAQEYERGLLDSSLAEDRAHLEANGMTFVEVDGAAYAAKAKDAVLLR